MTRLLLTIGLDSCGPEDMVTDFMTDLRHIADWAELDFEAISERSRMLYETEVQELDCALVAEEDGHAAF